MFLSRLFLPVNKPDIETSVSCTLFQTRSSTYEGLECSSHKEIKMWWASLPMARLCQLAFTTLSSVVLFTSCSTCIFHSYSPTPSYMGLADLSLLTLLTPDCFLKINLFCPVVSVQACYLRFNGDGHLVSWKQLSDLSLPVFRIFGKVFRSQHIWRM